MSDAPELMQSSEAARFLSLSKTTLIKWAERGLVPATKVDARWWFKRRELERWLAGGAGEAAGEADSPGVASVYEEARAGTARASVKDHGLAAHGGLTCSL